MDIPHSTFFLHIIYPAIYQENPVTKALPVLNGKTLWSFEIYNPAFKYYQTEAIPVFQDTSALIKAIRNFNKPLVIVTRESSLPNLQGVNYKVIYKQRDLFETPTTVLLEIR